VVKKEVVVFLTGTGEKRVFVSVLSVFSCSGSGRSFCERRAGVEQKSCAAAQEAVELGL
jgi:hypothetical protein